jgi:hypothetical protein
LHGLDVAACSAPQQRRTIIGLPSSEYSANWVGTGGFCENQLCTRGDKTLIQLGTEQDVAPDGITTQYYAWYEMLPAAETPLPANNIVKPGDTITASLVDKIRRMEPSGSTVDRRFRPFGPESSV